MTPSQTPMDYKEEQEEQEMQAEPQAEGMEVDNNDTP
jgi:hypothetical protein